MLLENFDVELLAGCDIVLPVDCGTVLLVDCGVVLLDDFGTVLLVDCGVLPDDFGTEDTSLRLSDPVIGSIDDVELLDEDSGKDCII